MSAGESSKIWGGRFSAGLSRAAAEYSDSQHYDRRLYSQDIRASKAHAAMLGRQGIISQEEAAAIVAGLDLVLAEIESGTFDWREALEDVHMNIESRLVELIGDTGKKLHTGRSRNDQTGLAFRLYVSEKCEKWYQSIVQLCRVLADIAEANTETLMPGFTHLQPAQPVTLAQHMLAYAGMFRRDADRLEDAQKRIKISPLGAAALAGATYPLDPQSVADEVGFGKIYANSMDAVSDRDFVLESLFCASLIITHLSRLCEELIIWSTPSFGFVTLPDEFSTGSSIMPQKKNPDIAELMRGKTGRIYGHLMAMLVILKGLPLAYNRDLQEDKENFFDTDEAVHSSLEIMAAMLGKIRFNAFRMKQALQVGYLNATELADYLVSLGLPFRDAHHAAGAAVAVAESKGVPLEELPLEELQKINPLISDDVFIALDYKNAVRRRETPGGTGPDSVARQLATLKEWLVAHSS